MASVASSFEVPAKYKVETNDLNKATELNLAPSKLGRSPQEGAHMRAFWGSTVSFFLAFVGWFALAPVAVDVAQSISICENQLFPPEEHPNRKAYLAFKTLNTRLPYCRFGTVRDGDELVGCAEVPAGEGEASMTRYRPDLLPNCVCTPGTHCADTLTYSGIGSVGVTIFVRIALGTLLERFGPINVQCALLSFGALWVALSTVIWNEWSFIVIRTMIGCAGATFVTNQFWCSLMFAPSVVGTANATAAGWGNLGGGVTQIFVVWALMKPFLAFGMSNDTAWRTAMAVPAGLFLLCAAALKMFCWDTPTAKRYSVQDSGKTTDASLWDYVVVLKDIRVVVMIFQYSACFGTELAMNAKLATHFRTYFQMDSGDAAALAGCFGLMNLFARSLGGIFSDTLFKHFGFRGRIWAQFIALVCEGFLLMGFAHVDDTKPWYTALIVIIFFSLCVQMAEGTSYGIVPFMIPQQLAVVSALVGAGGNMGAVIALWCFYKPLGVEDVLLPFKVHAAYVLFWAGMSVCYYWPDKGGLLCPARRQAKGKYSEKDINKDESDSVSETTSSDTA